MAQPLTGAILADTYNRLRNTWFEQSRERRALLKKVLLDHVKAEAGLKTENKTEVKRVIDNPYKDRLDDLLELINEPISTGNDSFSGSTQAGATEEIAMNNGN
jgi:hypothetical protein